EGSRGEGEAVDRAGELRFFAGVFRVGISLDDVAQSAEPPHCGPVRGRTQWAGLELRATHGRACSYQDMTRRNEIGTSTWPLPYKIRVLGASISGCASDAVSGRSAVI